MVEPKGSRVSLRRQCELLSFSRSGWYTAKDRRPSEEDTDLMAVPRVCRAPLTNSYAQRMNDRALTAAGRNVRPEFRLQSAAGKAIHRRKAVRPSPRIAWQAGRRR